MFVCCECCVLSGRGLCDGLITRPEESHRLWRVVVWDQETSEKTRMLKPATGLWKIKPQLVVTSGKQTNKQTNKQPHCFKLLILSSLSEKWERNLKFKWFIVSCELGNKPSWPTFKQYVLQKCGKPQRHLTGYSWHWCSEPTIKEIASRFSNC